MLGEHFDIDIVRRPPYRAYLLLLRVQKSVRTVIATVRMMVIIVIKIEKIEKRERLRWNTNDTYV